MGGVCHAWPAAARLSRWSDTRPSGLSLWLNRAFGLFVAVWVGAGTRFYGPQNFLGLRDFATILILFGLWLELPLLLSSRLVSVLLIDIVWCVDLAAAVIRGVHPFGAITCMFRADLIPLHLRLLSLFHAVVWPLLIYVVWRLGYDRRGWRLQTLIAWIVLPLIYWLTAPYRAINWVWRAFGQQQHWMPAPVHRRVCMLAYPLRIYLPTQGVICLTSGIVRRRGYAPR